MAASDKIGRGCSRAPQQLRSLAVVCCILAGVQIQTVCWCLQPQQQQQPTSVGQQQQASQQQQPAQMAQPADQQQQQQRQTFLGLADFGVGGGGGSASSADNMINLGQPASSYLNSKRARKMSAFMPMRGRKDGRDYYWQQQQLQQPQLQLQPAESFMLGGGGGGSLRESDGSDATILRLVMQAASNGLAAAATSAPPPPAATPRSFADQLAARRAAAAAAAAFGQPGLGSGSAGAAEVAAYESASAADSEPVGHTMMQAKLRRAFHPMRGKKASPTPPSYEGGGGGDFLFDQSTFDLADSAADFISSGQEM